MHLSRVRVPNFRALKNVDITFEDYFSPRFFPLASINGGGKSTLLQLIFTLLHCSGSKKNLVFIKNILGFIDIHTTGKTIELLDLELKNQDETIDLKFSLVPSRFFLDDFNSWLEGEENSMLESLDYSVFDFNFNEYIYSEKQDFLSQTKEIQQEIIGLRKSISGFLSVYKGKNPLGTDSYFSHRMDEIDFLLSLPFFSYEREVEKYTKIYQFRDYLAQLEQKYLEIENDYKLKEHLNEYCRFYGAFIITSIPNKDQKRYFLSCSSSNLREKNKNIEVFLSELSQKVYLYSSDSKIFLFTGRGHMKNIFMHPDKLSKNQSNNIQKSLLKIENFHTYNYVPVTELLESFKRARDLDFEEAIESPDRKYGNRYGELLKELDKLIPDKRIAPDPQLSEIKFKGGKDYNTTLYPEDLSHGELRKLGLYLWMKNKQIEDSIVLIDEIEIGLHPDWQYNIANDLIRNFPNNQYIVATHSYSICEAVTPAHIKEISPELTLNHDK